MYVHYDDDDENNMNSNKMFKSLIYKENSLIGEAQIYPQNNFNGDWMRKIIISHFSDSSDRSPPLAILYTIASDGFCLKMESPLEEVMIQSLYAECLGERKTAVVQLGNKELHLVALPSRTNPLQYSCFWGFIVASGWYNPSIAMFNLRCLGIVFDLDETLVVANTLRTFEDKIIKLQQKISIETDKQRLVALSAEVKSYQDEKTILQQFIQNDQVVENGTVFSVKTEVGPSSSESFQQVSRPIIRLKEKSIILTRINPENRDTSVLVRVRPAWEELRRYLNARGRKRFEVYVCTMAEREYAFEIWRLLDPESRLINCDQLQNRIVCVKSDTKKSLHSVFQSGKCHPKMGLIVDDRVSVWDFNDQSQVYVVPVFAPYFSPNAEGVGSIAVLSVARNVACNVRGGFFKEYDDNLLPCMITANYEDEMRNFPSAPDVSNYIIQEEDYSLIDGNLDPLSFEGIADIETERSLKHSPAREEGEINESELDSDTMKRYLELLHAELEVKPRRPSALSQRHPIKNETTQNSERRSHRLLNIRSIEDLNLRDRVNYRHKRRAEEAYHGYERLPRKHLRSNHSSSQGEDMIRRHYFSTKSKDARLESFPVNDEFSKDPIEVLKDVTWQAGAKVKYQTALVDTVELQFIVEVWFVGRKIGEGVGKTRKEAQKHAAWDAILNLASYVSEFSEPGFSLEKVRAHAKRFGFRKNSNFQGYSSKNYHLQSTSNDSWLLDYPCERSTNPFNSVAALKELCFLEDFRLSFEKLYPEDKQKVHVQAEVEGKVLGKGTGSNWDLAKLDAAEDALDNFGSMFGPSTSNFKDPPRVRNNDCGKRRKKGYARCRF